MKVSEIKYERYTIERARSEFEKFRRAASEAKSARDMVEARNIFLRMYIDYNTEATLCHIRFTLDSRDKFYSDEMDYYNETGPLFEEIMLEYANIMLSTPYLDELKKLLNPKLFKKYEVMKKSFSPDIIEESKIENKIVTEYSKLMSEMKFELDGKTMPLSVLRGSLMDTDRDVRRRAAYAIGEGLEKHAAELDDIYDRLVKIRDKQAKKMGYKNFVELGYYRMGRTDYGFDDVAKFRDNVKNSLVPAVAEIKAGVARDLGIDKIMYYDDAVYSKGEVPKPCVDASEIFRRAVEMYDDMNPEIGAFMHKMVENDAFDYIAREGKWGGGYCTRIQKYDQAFILANFNGTSGDIDVITHEFGHALAMGYVGKYGDPELDVGSMETAECHSMSMEFFCWKYTEKFFGDKANAYRLGHLLSALSFIPYGVIVDEFQHIVYSNPDMTPKERKEAYLSLEKKYRPYLSWEGIPYLEEGTRWQYQMHIFESPFYYIDYCLAQTVAINFLIKSREDYEGALKTYMEFAKKGGTERFGELVADAGIPSPFADGALETMCRKVIEIADELKK